MAARAHPLPGVRVHGLASLSTLAVAYAPHLVQSTMGRGPQAAMVRACPCGRANASANLGWCPPQRSGRLGLSPKVADLARHATHHHTPSNFSHR